MYSCSILCGVQKNKLLCPRKSSPVLLQHMSHKHYSKDRLTCCIHSLIVHMYTRKREGGVRQLTSLRWKSSGHTKVHHITTCTYTCTASIGIVSIPKRYRFFWFFDDFSLDRAITGAFAFASIAIEAKCTSRPCNNGRF